MEERRQLLIVLVEEALRQAFQLLPLVVVELFAALQLTHLGKQVAEFGVVQERRVVLDRVLQVPEVLRLDVLELLQKFGVVLERLQEVLEVLKVMRVVQPLSQKDFGLRQVADAAVDRPMRR